MTNVSNKKGYIQPSFKIYQLNKRICDGVGTGSNPPDAKRGSYEPFGDEDF